jgi:hypothetical protein
MGVGLVITVVLLVLFVIVPMYQETNRKDN